MPSLVDGLTTAPLKAPHVIGPKQKRAMRPTATIPQEIIDEARVIHAEPWDPEKHVAPKAQVIQHLMKDIGLEGHGISPVAVTDPFPLFTHEAILQIRREIFSESVLRDCRFKSDFNANMIRGMGYERAPFTYEAWWSPEVLARVSEAAGVELVPAFDYEVANINISVDDQNATEVVTYGDETSAVAWHYDSFPFVCVAMASDCTGMVGGETAIELPNGEERRVRGPAMVSLFSQFCHQPLRRRAIFAEGNCRGPALSCKDATSITRLSKLLVAASALPWSLRSVPKAPSLATSPS